MREVAVIGVGMTRFGKFIDTSLRELGRVAILEAMNDAGVKPSDIQVGYCGNAVGGVITGQTMVLGQLLFREVGITGIPITNVENACSTGSSALREAWIAVASGMYDVALAVGTEKLYAADTVKSVQALAGAADFELEADQGLIMPAVWAMRANKYMEKYGATIEQLAKVSVKNHRNGALNPKSQYQNEVTLNRSSHPE